MSQPPLIAGVELGGTKCICILASGPDAVRAEVRIPTTTPEATLGAIEATLDGWRGFTAIGIASFGPVALDHRLPNYGSITRTTKPGWSDTDIVQRLSQRFNLPTGFDTDVNGAALAEGRWGASAGLSEHAYITVGTGVGVGLIMASVPVSGMSHAELGHVRPVRLNGDDWAGHCAFHGACVEGIAAGPAIAARTGQPASSLSADDPVWDQVSHALAQLCHTLVLTGIPRRIVIGGGVPIGAPHLLPRIRAKLRISLGDYGATSQIEPVDTYIVPAALGDRAGPLGAIILGQTALSKKISEQI